MKKRNKTLISVAIPCYRSENNIEHVVKNIIKKFDSQNKYDYEIILANDGSPDNTFEKIKNLCAENKKIIGIDLSRNFSQANARMSMLNYVNGEVVVFMDDDGQHPAEGIFLLANKIMEGYDDVCAKFINKKVTAFKRVTSDIYNQIMVWMGIYPKDIVISPFFALSRFAIKEARKYHSPSPSIQPYMLRVTTRFANVEIEQQKRLSGKSGYTFKKLLSLALMNMTNFSNVPLRISVLIGTIISILGFFYGAFLIIKKILKPSVLIGYTSLMATMLILFGIVLIIMGLLGEYIGRIYMILSDLPQYTIREVINSEKVAVRKNIK